MGSFQGCMDGCKYETNVSIEKEEMCFSQTKIKYFDVVSVLQLFS